MKNQEENKYKSSEIFQSNTSSIQGGLKNFFKTHQVTVTDEEIARWRKSQAEEENQLSQSYVAGLSDEVRRKLYF